MFRRAGGAGNQQVQIARCFAPAAQRARWRDLFDAVKGKQVSRDALRSFFSHVNAEAAGAAAIVVDALAQLLDLLLAHARQASQAAGLDRLGELVDAADFSCVP